MVVRKGKKLIKLKHAKLLFPLCQPQLHNAVVEIFLYHLFIHNNLKVILPTKTSLRQMLNERFPLQHHDDGHYRNVCALLSTAISQHYCWMMLSLPVTWNSAAFQAHVSRRLCLPTSKDDHFRVSLVKISSVHRACRSPPCCLWFLACVLLFSVSPSCERM